MARRMSVEARREQLLALGLEQFSARSYDDVSIDDLASAAGISKGLLYHYFPTKRHFYTAALQVASERLLADIHARAEAEALPRDRPRAGLDAYLGYVHAHGPAYVAVLRGGIGSDPEVARIVDGVRRSFVDRLVEGMGVQPVPVVRLALSGWVGFVEAASVDLVAHGDVDRVAVRDLLVAVLEATLAVAFSSP